MNHAVIENPLSPGSGETVEVVTGFVGFSEIAY
jgi:hypothetical protein